MSAQTRTRVARTLLQLIVGGGLYALTQQLAKDVPQAYAPYLVIFYTLLVALAQNLIEDMKGSDLVTRTPGQPK